jgi:hypothetical protein
MAGTRHHYQAHHVSLRAFFPSFNIAVVEYSLRQQPKRFFAEGQKYAVRTTRAPLLQRYY